MLFGRGAWALIFESEWRLRSLAEQYEVMARERTIIRFDWRNTGLSSRGIEDVGCAAHVADLLALQDYLGYERMALRIHGAAQVGIRYAATHPDRVSALILSSPSIRAASAPSITQQILGIAAGGDWRMFSRLLAASIFGWEGEEATWAATTVEAAVTPTDFWRAMLAGSDDVSGLSDSVRCPTLIVQREIVA